MDASILKNEIKEDDLMNVNGGMEIASTIEKNNRNIIKSVDEAISSAINTDFLGSVKAAVVGSVQNDSKEKRS